MDRILVHESPQLHDPVLVISLEGWIDAGIGAAGAMGRLLEDIETTLLVTFDTDFFIDQRARRPVVRIVDGVTTELTWPEVQLRYGADKEGSDLLVLVGPEPDFHWGDFTEIVTALAQQHGVRLVVGLGAFPAPTPHTRPVRVIGTAPTPSQYLLERVGTVQGEIEVPAGIMTALEMGFSDTDIPVVTLWARVPHYVASMAYPQASAALLDSLAGIAGLAIDSTGLRAAADEARLHVDELVTNNPDHALMVRSLEQAADENEGNSLGDNVPNGDQLAAELERFLRGEES
jgi:proteasome assembly chaperone (PAC2) family protein